jgi:hypothetical protein
MKVIQKEAFSSLLLWLFLATGRRMTIKTGDSITLAVTMVEVGKSLWAAYIRTCRLPSTEVGHADEIPDAEIASDRSYSTLGPGCLFTRRFLAQQPGYLLLIVLDHLVILGDAPARIFGDHRALRNRPPEQIDLSVEFLDQLLLIHGETQRRRET